MEKGTGVFHIFCRTVIDLTGADAAAVVVVGGVVASGFDMGASDPTKLRELAQLLRRAADEADTSADEMTIPDGRVN